LRTQKICKRSYLIKVNKKNRLNKLDLKPREKIVANKKPAKTKTNRKTETDPVIPDWNGKKQEKKKRKYQPKKKEKGNTITEQT
jgi:hypothetical protein